MIHYITDGDIPAVGATVLSLGDGDAWVPVAPAAPHDLAAVDVPTYEDRGIGAADLPWVDAVVRETLQSEVEHTLAMAGEPAACVCAACRGAGRPGAAVAWPPVGAICGGCGDPADMVCRIL